jgi:hypothetical protein
MRNGFARIAVLALITGASLAGCRYQGGASFLAATTPNLEIGHHDQGQWAGDPYATGGIAEASGGTLPQTRYSAGVNLAAHDPLNPKYDQPGMGTSQTPGNYTVNAAPGFEKENGPGLQPTPSSVNTPSANAGP